MKIRTCFVSNSSSSSCVCDLCGKTETGWDLCVGDAGMFICVNDHTVCQDEAVIDFNDWIDERERRELAGESMEPAEYGVPEKYCPFCCMIEFTQSDLKRYLYQKTHIPDEKVLAEVKAANKHRKKLYASEYVMYVLGLCGIKTEDLIKEIKEKFSSYAEFRKAL